MAKQQQKDAKEDDEDEKPSEITVEVIGYGGGEESER
jgi:hypothetical protein